MKRWQKRLLIILGVILIVIATLFIVFHDNSDLEAIEKEQKESIKEATSEDKFDAISDDFQEFEDSIAVSQ